MLGWILLCIEIWLPVWDTFLGKQSLGHGERKYKLHSRTGHILQRREQRSGAAKQIFEVKFAARLDVRSEILVHEVFISQYATVSVFLSLLAFSKKNFSPVIVSLCYSLEPSLFGSPLVKSYPSVCKLWLRQRRREFLSGSDIGDLNPNCFLQKDLPLLLGKGL